MSALAGQIAAILSSIVSAVGDVLDKLIAALASIVEALIGTNSNCGILKDGKQYYLKSVDGRFAVVDAANQWALMNPISTSPSKFTVVQKSCNVYGLCVNGFCMSRCPGCTSPLSDVQSVKFNVTDSNSPSSQWLLTVVSGRVGVYNLEVDGTFGYLTYKRTRTGTALLALDPQLTNQSQFEFIEVVDNCGVILENGKQYYMRQSDFRYAVLDPIKNLAFMRAVPPTNASIFTAIQKSCNLYGFCIGSACMARCHNCASDTGDVQTVRFHVSDTNGPYSQWTLTSRVGEYGGPYSLTAEPEYGNLIYKTTLPAYEDQLTLAVTDQITNFNEFEFVEVNQI